MTFNLVSKQDQSEMSGRKWSPEQAAAAAMMAQARQQGIELTGPDGLLKLYTENVLEIAAGKHFGTLRARRTPTYRYLPWRLW